jgi:uncharacterized protein YndB with AHSA1/START domain
MSEQRGSVSTAEHEVTLTRTFDAPRELVWKAWTEPTHFTHWFGTPPFTTPVSEIRMDVRPGGEWTATQVSDTGDMRMVFVGTYREVREPERLVMTFENADDRSDPNIEVATVTLSDVGGKTEMVFDQTGHLPEEQYPLLGEGYSRFFDRMADHLATL